MICRITIYWGCEGGLPASLDIVVPPVCIPTVSAVWLYYGLFFHVLTRPIHEMINKIILLARIRIQIDETDFAAGNDKLFHFLLSQNMPDIWHDLKICHSHQNHIIQGAICAIIGLELVSFLYCLSSLLRVSGYFLRMHQAVPKAVDSLLNCRHIEIDGPPLPPYVTVDIQPKSCNTYCRIQIMVPSTVKKNWRLAISPTRCTLCIPFLPKSC